MAKTGVVGAIEIRATGVVGMRAISIMVPAAVSSSSGISVVKKMYMQNDQRSH